MKAYLYFFSKLIGKRLVQEEAQARDCRGSKDILRNSTKSLKALCYFHKDEVKMVIFVYGKCSTCKAALLFLKELGAALTEKDISKEPPSVAELKQMLSYQNGNLKKLFNTSGLLYKEMQLKEKLQHLSIDEAIALLNRHGMLVKRPFLLGKDFGLLGFNATEWSKKF